jgi:hypothetical protein
MVAVVDLDTNDVAGHDLAPLENCGVVVPIPGAPNQVGVRCLGFGLDTDATAGLVVLEVGADGTVTERTRFLPADHEGRNVTGNVLFLTERYFVGIELGGWDDPTDPDVVHLVDLDTGAMQPLLTTERGTDVLGTMAFYPDTGVVLVPSRSQGLHRLHFDGATLTKRDTITLVPTRLPVADVSRIR